MKLFLASTNITPELEPHFKNLVGKNFSDIRFALIENAADPYSEAQKEFVYETRNAFQSLHMDLELIDLRKYKSNKDICTDLKKFDVIWVGGGNTFYLRWIFKESGFDTVITQLINEGIVYGGGSAGAIIAGPTLEKFDLVDDVSKSPAFLNDGLNLINLILIPHWGYEKFQTKLQKIENYYENTSYKVVTLSDDQALVIDGASQTICPTPTK